MKPIYRPTYCPTYGSCALGGVAIAAHYDFSDTTTMFTNAGGTIEVSADGQEILRMKDVRDNGAYLRARDSIHGPTYRPNLHGSLSSAASESSNDGTLWTDANPFTQTDKFYWMGVAYYASAGGGSICGIRHDQQESNVAFQYHNGSNGQGLYSLTTNDQGSSYGTTLYDAANVGVGWHLFEASWDQTGALFSTPWTGPVTTIARNGVVGSTTNTHRYKVTPNGLSLFAMFQSIGSRLQGAIGEILVWDGIPDADEIITKRVELQTKWSTPALP